MLKNFKSNRQKLNWSWIANIAQGFYLVLLSMCYAGCYKERGVVARTEKNEVQHTTLITNMGANLLNVKSCVCWCCRYPSPALSFWWSLMAGVSNSLHFAVWVLGLFLRIGPWRTEIDFRQYKIAISFFWYPIRIMLNFTHLSFAKHE